MGLLDGKKALIFGVANDHSIAWGIAKALHDQGATVGFSSVESLIERRQRRDGARQRLPGVEEDAVGVEDESADTAQGGVELGRGHRARW